MTLPLVRLARDEDLPHLEPIGRAADRLFVDAGHPEYADLKDFPLDALGRAVTQGRLLVAEWEGVVVGWMYLTRSQGELCVGHLCVEPSYGRRGVGTALLRAAIDRARRAGEHTVVLNTESDVPWNRPWYERHGFVVVPRTEWNEDMHRIAAEQTAEGLRWDGRVHMRLTLREG